MAALRPAVFGFFVLWASWCVLFFSLSRGKLPPYVLPAAPALALLVGAYVERMLFHQPVLTMFRQAQGLIPRGAMVTVALVWLIGIVCFWAKRLINPFSQPLEFVDVFICLACIAAVALWGRRASPRALWACCAAVVFSAGVDIGQEFVPAWSEDRSLFARSSEKMGELLAPPGTVVACYGREWGSVPFYLPDSRVHNFHKCDPELLRAFLREHARTLLIVKQNNTPETMQWVLSPGLRFGGFVPLGEANILVVEAMSPKVRLAAR
jgi:dolichol-phosphate mannosyltransferase